MKVCLLHPPMYPVNIDFYNILGRDVDLFVYMFGESPKNHPWDINRIKDRVSGFKLKVYGKGNCKPSISYNPFFLKDLINIAPDIIMSIAFWPPSYYAGFIKEKTNSNLVILTNATQETENKKGHLRHLFRKAIINKTDGFIAASPFTVNYLKQIVPPKKWDKIFLSVQTIDVKDWVNKQNGLESKTYIKRKYGIPTHKTVLLGVGVLSSLKNWESVFKILPSLNADIFFILVGDGPAEEELKKTAYQLGVNEKVIFAGRKDGVELMEVYKMADVFVFPSFNETFGFVVAEALASGLPVLCSENAGAKCLIENGQNGYLIKTDEDFTSKIKNLFNNYSYYSENAFYSMQKYSLEKRAQEFINFFKLLNG